MPPWEILLGNQKENRGTKGLFDQMTALSRFHNALARFSSPIHSFDVTLTLIATPKLGFMSISNRAKVMRPNLEDMS